MGLSRKVFTGLKLGDVKVSIHCGANALRNCRVSARNSRASLFLGGNYGF